MGTVHRHGRQTDHQARSRAVDKRRQEGHQRPPRRVGRLGDHQLGLAERSPNPGPIGLVQNIEGGTHMATDRTNAMDHMVVVLFENRSLDNVLGHLYGPEDGKTFEGVIGKNLSNPIPEWAEHGADRKAVPYGVATDMDSPNPDSGEEYFHTNTQLFNTIDDHNRFRIGEGVTAPWNAPPAGSTPTMDGFVTDYISTLTGELGRQPTYEEYAHIMT